MTGRNLQHILDASGHNPWSPPQVRVRDALAAGERVEVPPQDGWRLPYLGSLIIQRRTAFNLALELIDSLVTNQMLLPT